MCDEMMGKVADHTLGTTEHFRHERHSTCPIDTENRINY